MQCDRRSTHSIVTDNPKVTIPLKSKGTISHFPAQKPTQEDLQNLEQIHLMGTEQWEPSPEELPLPTRTVSASTSTVPKPDLEEVEARCIGKVCIPCNTPLELTGITQFAGVKPALHRNHPWTGPQWFTLSKVSSQKAMQNQICWSKSDQWNKQ